MEKLVDPAQMVDDTVTQIAWLYYMEGMIQEDISKLLGLSRSRVLRSLSAARSSGLVQIRVATRLNRCVELERMIEKRHGIERAIVIPTPPDVRDTSAQIGTTLAAYVADNIHDNMKIGLGWGRTLNASLAAIPHMETRGISIMSLLGGLTKVSGVNPSEFAWRVADRLSAECYLLAAPVFAPDQRTREALLTHPGIQEVFALAKHLDMAIVSAGELSPNSTITEHLLIGGEEIVSMQQRGVVGDVLCRFIDIEGNVVDIPLNKRVIAVDPVDLRSARKLVLASGGWGKYAVIRGAMKLLQPHVLITDELVAERLALE